MADMSYQVFVALDATALEGGYIYIGEQNADPEQSPIPVYWDEAQTVVATQPLRTSGGVIVRDGTPADIYAAVPAYSIRVRDRSGLVVWYKPTTGGAEASRLTFPIPSGPPGADSTVPGPADNTYSSYADMQASDPTRASARLVGDTDVPPHPDGPYNNPTKTVGGWVPQGADGVNFDGRSTDAKLRETVSVTDARFAGGAKGDGVTDDTAAFNAAIATGKTVTVPKTAAGYVVNGIAVVSNMEIVGEKSGECLGPELIVAVNNGCVFLQAATTDIAVHLVFRNLTMRAATGVTGASGFRSADKSKYTAYCTFENIETHRNLVWGYDLLPIYTDWINCRDGYLPGIGGFTMVHGFIKAEAATYGQTNATNTNNVIRAKVFGCYGVDASIQIAFGDTWLIEDCRFENMFVPAVKAQSVIGLYTSRPRNEGFHTTEWSTLREMSGSGVGTIEHRDAALNAIDEPGFLYANTDAISKFGIQRSSFSIVGPGQRLCNNPLALLYNRDHPTIAGAGAAGLMTDMQHDRRVAGQALTNGAAPSSNMALTHLNLGGSAATRGFGSGKPAVAVAGDWVTIFTPAADAGVAEVAAVQTSGGGDGIGTQHVWPVRFTVSQTRTGADTINSAGIVAEFRRQGADLQMRCTTGSGSVTVSALIAS